jgi:hypothetical protein
MRAVQVAAPRGRLKWWNVKSRGPALTGPCAAAKGPGAQSIFLALAVVVRVSGTGTWAGGPNDAVKPGGVISAADVRELDVSALAYVGGANRRPLGMIQAGGGFDAIGLARLARAVQADGVVGHFQTGLVHVRMGMVAPMPVDAVLPAILARLVVPGGSRQGQPQNRQPQQKQPGQGRSRVSSHVLFAHNVPVFQRVHHRPDGGERKVERIRSEGGLFTDAVFGQSTDGVKGAD